MVTTRSQTLSSKISSIMNKKFDHAELNIEKAKEKIQNKKGTKRSQTKNTWKEEGRVAKSKNKPVKIKKEVIKNDESSECEWEEVTNINQAQNTQSKNPDLSKNVGGEFLEDFEDLKKPEVDKKVLQISLNKPLSKKEIREMKILDYYRMEANRNSKMLANSVHIVYLQFVTANLKFISLQLCKSASIKFENAIDEILKKVNPIRNIKYLNEFSQIIAKIISLYSVEPKLENLNCEKSFKIMQHIQQLILCKIFKVNSNLFPIILFIILTCLNLPVKLCFALNPPILKPKLIPPDYNKSLSKRSQVKVEVFSNQNNDTETANDLNNTLKSRKKIVKKSIKNENDKKIAKKNSTQFVKIWLEVTCKSSKNDSEDDLWIFDGATNINLLNISEFISNLDQTCLKYIIGIDKLSNLHDITLRYARKWSYCRKGHVNFQYYQDLLKFQSNLSEKEIEKETLTTLNIIKKHHSYESAADVSQHPLFFIQKNIQKYQVMYPINCEPEFFIKNEPVYSKIFLHNIHTETKWIQVGKQVKQGEIPCKIVKSIKVDENNQKLNSNLFGSWQVENFKPSKVIDGIIPKNEYGNVYLFNESMLPEGSVFFPLKGINKIAIKFKRDYALAVTGWDFHGGSSHVILGGYVICKKDEYKIIKEWLQDKRHAYTKKLLLRFGQCKKNWNKLYKHLKTAKQLHDEYL